MISFTIIPISFNFDSSIKIARDYVLKVFIFYSSVKYFTFD